MALRDEIRNSVLPQLREFPVTSLADVQSESDACGEVASAPRHGLDASDWTEDG